MRSLHAQRDRRGLELCSSRVFRSSAIAPAAGQILALRGRCADAATTIAREGARAALRLALIVLEEEKGIWSGLEFRAIQRLIRRSITPSTHAIIRVKLHIVKCANHLVLRTRRARCLSIIVHEAFHGSGRHEIKAHYHKKVCDNQKD